MNNKTFLVDLRAALLEEVTELQKLPKDGDERERLSAIFVLDRLQSAIGKALKKAEFHLPVVEPVVKPVERAPIEYKQVKYDARGYYFEAAGARYYTEQDTEGKFFTSGGERKDISIDGGGYFYIDPPSYKVYLIGLA